MTAERPVAWVDVTVDENAELIAADSQTAMRLTGTARDQGVFLISEEVGVAGSGNGRLGSTDWTTRCATGAQCGATLRLTAILVDPIGHPSVDVEFTATADAFFQSNQGPVPSAAVAVDVGEIETRSAAALGLASTQSEEIHLGPDRPRAIRTIRLSLPEGLPADTTLLPNTLVTMTEIEPDEDYNADVQIRSWANGEEVGVPWSAAGTPFGACQVGVACDAELKLEFSWNGGPAEGSTVEWSLAAWPGVGSDEPAEPATIDAPVATDVSWDGPVLAASISGQTALTDSGDPFTKLNAALDLSDVPQGAGDVEGLLRLTVRASLVPGTDAAAKVRLSFGGTDIEMPGPGETVTAYSRADDITCGGRSLCPLEAAYSFGFNKDSRELPDAVVDWTADVEFLPLGSGEVPDGATIDLVVPSPPP